MGSGMDHVGSRIELERYLDSVRHAQSLSIERLQQLSLEAQVERRCQELANAQQRLRAAQPASSTARLLLESASSAGNDTREKIEEAMEVYERARQARETADQVTALRAGVQGIHGAMEVRDWERAAQLAYAALQVPPSVAESEFARKMVPSSELPENPADTLKAACDDLLALFLREFNAAARARQVDQLTRYFKLFPLVGHAPAGLEAYASFLRQIIANLAKNLLVSAGEATRRNSIFYGAVWTKLFENLAVVIEQHGKLIIKHYGPEAMAQVLKHVQPEIDKQAGLIIDTFWDERRVGQLMQRASNYDFPGLVSSFGSINEEETKDICMEEDVDLRDGSARLSEISAILSRFELYTAFIQSRFNTNLVSTISERLNMLSDAFTTLGVFVFRRSVERAVVLDELPSQQTVGAREEFSMEAPLASSLVEDVMYVFSSVLSSLMATHHRETQQHTCGGLHRVLEGDLVGSLQRKLRSAAPSAAVHGEFGGAGPFMLYLNDLELVSGYVLEAVSKQNAEFFNVESFRKKCNELVADGCQTLVSTRLVGQSNQAVSAFKSSSHEFERQWKQILRPLRQLLHPKVLSRVLNSVCTLIAEGLEQHVWSLDGKISVAGSLELEKDISVAISCCVETQYGLRRCFTKLAQIVTALVEGDTAGLSAEDGARVARFRMDVAE